MAYTIKISHPIFHMDFSHNRTTLFFFSHYFFACSFESALISHTKKEVHMYVKLQFCVWNLFHTQNFTCLIYFTCISRAFHVYFTRLLLVVNFTNILVRKARTRFRLHVKLSSRLLKNCPKQVRFSGIFWWVVHLRGLYRKIQTAQGTNQKAPFWCGPVHPWINTNIKASLWPVSALGFTTQWLISLQYSFPSSFNGFPCMLFTLP